MALDLWRDARRRRVTAHVQLLFRRLPTLELAQSRRRLGLGSLRVVFLRGPRLEEALLDGRTRSGSRAERVPKMTTVEQ